MAQKAREQSTAVALRLVPPPNYNGTAQSWRVLCEAIWPAAKSSEAIMLAVSYCSARHLDPFKKPVHIVPVYNSSLRREVETVWPGINELLTTASRSKEFAGVDEPVLGPMETRTFHGTERPWTDRNGVDHEGKPVSITVTFPVWCSVKVWRRVGGERVAFSQPVYWIEAYGRQSFRSELPKDMWEKRPLGQLHKCALAASLRLGFPEDVNDYAAEEMEGREVEAGGVVIDHDPRDADPDRRIEQPPPSAPSGDATAGQDPLDEPNGSKWLLALSVRLAGAVDLTEIVELRRDPRVVAAYEKAPQAIKGLIDDAFRVAHERLAPKVEDPPPEDDPPPAGADDWPDDPIRELLAEIEAMDLIALDGLPSLATWRAKVRDLFPPDRDRIDEAIADRRRLLKGGKAK